MSYSTRLTHGGLEMLPAVNLAAGCQCSLRPGLINECFALTQPKPSVKQEERKLEM